MSAGGAAAGVGRSGVGGLVVEIPSGRQLFVGDGCCSRQAVFWLVSAGSAFSAVCCPPALAVKLPRCFWLQLLCCCSLGRDRRRQQQPTGRGRMRIIVSMGVWTTAGPWQGTNARRESSRCSPRQQPHHGDAPGAWSCCERGDPTFSSPPPQAERFTPERPRRSPTLLAALTSRQQTEFAAANRALQPFRNASRKTSMRSNTAAAPHRDPGPAGRTLSKLPSTFRGVEGDVAQDPVTPGVEWRGGAQGGSRICGELCDGSSCAAQSA